MARVYRGSAYAKQGNYDLAAADFNFAIFTDPKLMDGFFGLGFVYYMQGRLDEALVQIDRALEKFEKIGKKLGVI